MVQKQQSKGGKRDTGNTPTKTKSTPSGSGEKAKKKKWSKGKVRDKVNKTCQSVFKIGYDPVVQQYELRKSPFPCLSFINVIGIQ